MAATPPKSPRGNLKAVGSGAKREQRPEIGKVDCELLWIPIKLLKPHPSIQRRFRQYIADRISKRFDPAKLGELRVILVDGIYLVFDGQHRLSAARVYLRDEEQMLPCMVYRDLAPERVASICRGLNSSVAWVALDEFMLRVQENEQQACEISGVLREFGLRLDPVRSEGTIQAVKALDWVYQYTGGAASVKSAIALSVSAFQKAPNSFDGAIIKGLALFFMIHKKADKASLVARMKANGGPSKLIGQSKDRSKLDGVNATRAMALTLLTIYNKGRKAKDRLERPKF